MTKQPHKTRRAFLSGKGAVEAIQSSVLPAATEASAPETVASNGDSYLMEVSRSAMACEFQAYLRAESGSTDVDAAISGLDLVADLERQLTVYRDDSEIARLNRLAGVRPVVLESELFELLKRGLELSEETQGAFDFTAGALVKAWGFYRRQGAFPNPEELKLALSKVNFRQVRLDDTNRECFLEGLGMEINLGAIGKGYALDRWSRHLREHGAKQFILHGGNSSVLAQGNRAGGDNPSDPGWRVRLRHPLFPDRVLGEIQLVNQALGTSGAGNQFFYHQDKRYGHILDPRTGYPAEGVLSASVIAPTAAIADAMSTAFYVMGMRGARDYCQNHAEIGAIIVIPNGSDISIENINVRPETWRPERDFAVDSDRVL